MDIKSYFTKPKIIAFLQEKGGSGKTTLARNIGYGLQRLGLKVILIDSDSQRTLSDWSSQNGGELIPVAAQNKDTLETLKNNYSSYDVIIVDTPGKLEKCMLIAIKIADIVLIPVQPTPDDLWASLTVAELINARKEVTNGKPDAAFVLSRVIKNTLLSRDIREPLSEYGIPILDSYTSQMVCYPTSAAEGKTVFNSVTGLQGAAEIKNIIEELLRRFVYETKS